MESLTKEHFDMWMNRISEHQEQMMEELNRLKEQSPVPTTDGDGERMLDNADLCQLLNVSQRTMQRYRTLGLIPYSILRRRIYYKESDVCAFIQKYNKEMGIQLSEKIDQLKRPSWKKLYSRQQV